MIVRLVVNQHCRLGWWFEREYFSHLNRDDCFTILFENKQKVEDIIVGIDWISLLKK